MTRISEEKTLQIQYESVMRDNQLLKTKVDELEGRLQDSIEQNNKLKLSSSNRISEIQSKLEREKELQVQVNIFLNSCVIYPFRPSVVAIYRKTCSSNSFQYTKQ